jgi:hypothetical protein
MFLPKVLLAQSLPAVPSTVDGIPRVCLEVSFATSLATKLAASDTLKLQLEDTENLLGSYRLQLKNYSVLEAEQRKLIATQVERITILTEDIADLKTQTEYSWLKPTLFVVGGFSVGIGSTLLITYLVNGAL